MTVMRGDLRSVADSMALSRRTLRVIKSNLFWAFGYNVAAIPLAALGLLESDAGRRRDGLLLALGPRQQPAPAWIQRRLSGVQAASGSRTA